MKKAFVCHVVLFFIFLMYVSSAFSEQLSFSYVWNQISAESPAQKSAEFQTQAASAAKDRAGRHWLPTVYMDAAGYGTNDPGSAFFGLLEQRSLKQSDFNPDSINHPGDNIYMRGALGIDMPLYEGGMRSTQVKIQEHALAAAENESSQIRLEEYSQAGLSFVSIAILAKQKKKLEDLNVEIEKFMKNYQLGQKSNPVGYSGLLGMKSLSNRISGFLSQYNAQMLSHYFMLREMGVNNNEWLPDISDAVQFAENYLMQETESSGSYRQASLQEIAFAGAEAGKIEKAKSLPRLGAFAESYVFNGDRDTANGYTAGLYLKWNIFDPSSYRTFEEAGLKAAAAKKSSEAYARQERAQRSGLQESVKALKDNIAIINESDKILLEQIEVMKTLFKNGAVSALQLIEVLNRRVDLIAQQNEAELAFVKSSAQAVTLEKFDIQKRIEGIKD
ncbi:MAG: TolC family protein [Endomicrobia bacterium]|nr:TolC family protein [Endomicrobiia bacterium]